MNKKIFVSGLLAANLAIGGITFVLPKNMSGQVNVLASSNDSVEKGLKLNKTNWKLVGVDSAHSSSYGGEKAFDDNVSTLWHTSWENPSPNYPHEIIIDTGRVQWMNGFGYVKRQDSNSNGDIKEYEFYISEDGENWGKPIRKGSFPNTKPEIYVSFEETQARYIKLTGINSQDGAPYAAAAEINLYKDPSRIDVHVESVQLDKKSLKTKQGDIRTLFANIAPLDSENKQVKWISSRPDVVRVHELNDYSQGVILDSIKHGTAIITVTTEDGRKVASAKITVEKSDKNEINKNKLNHYYGSFHEHTSYSDGSGTPETAFKHAKEGGRADFLSISDHQPGITQQEWFNTVKAAEEATDENFLALASTESGYESNTYLDEDGQEVKNGGEATVHGFGDYSVLKGGREKPAGGYVESVDKFVQALENSPNSVAIFAHPQEAGWPTDKLWNSFNKFKDYSKVADELFVGLEVSNDSSGPYNLLHEFSYPMALDNGWHMGPVGVEDSHSGGWTTKFDTRTVILAPELDAYNVQDALKNQRFYSTEDYNTKLDFTINSKIMGSTLNPAVWNYHVNVNIEDPDTSEEDEKFKKIEIISDYGQVVYSEEVDSHQVELNVKLESNTSRYYFVRAVKQNGKRTWSSPIWTGRAADPILKNVSKGERIDRSNWSIVSTTNEKPGTVKYAFDGNVNTSWETTAPTGEIVVDMGEIKSVTGFGFKRNRVPYMSYNETNKLLRHVKYSISNDGMNWKEVVDKIVTGWGEEIYTPIEKEEARYIKIEGLDSIGGNNVAACEFFVYENGK